MAIFLTNEINTTERDITDPAHVQITFPLNDKKMQGIFEDIFSGT